ncbi:MAG: hypothetical protein M0038_10005 [Pseudomonadota bacterium]|jgi:hypothetical protein|nr:hypothetical protein [Pseudomonadota bacterium]
MASPAETGGSAFNTTDAVLKAAAGLVVTEVTRVIAEARGAAEAAGTAGVKAGVAAGAANLTDLRNQLAVVLNEGLAKITAETKASRIEAERLRAAGARPAVVRAIWISALSAVVLLGAGLGAGYWYGRRVAGAHFVADTMAARWAISPAGRAAFALDQANQNAGGIGVFTRCAGTGWHTEGRTCWPFTSKPAGRVEGWLLPR